MRPRSIESYGGIKRDVLEVEYADGEVTAGEHNRLTEDAAQMSRTSPFAVVLFPTTADAAPAAVSPSLITVRSHMGTGIAAKPAIQKTDTGLYELTWPESYVDALDVEEQVEIAIAEATLAVAPSAGSARVVSWTDTTIEVQVADELGNDDDVADGRVLVKAWL